MRNPPSYVSSKPPRYSVAVGEPSPRPSISEDASPASAADLIVISERPRQLKFISQRRRHRSAQDTRTKQDRRRHFSAQDHRKPLLSDDGENEVDENMRQRCFSFNALKDAFSRRSQQNVLECQSLLFADGGEGEGGGADSVFSSREVVSSPGPSLSPVMAAATTAAFVHNNNSSLAMSNRTFRRPPQQVSFEDRILEESNENLDTATTHRTDLLKNHSNTNIHLRQRHFSAPDRTRTQNFKSRHSSGNT